MRHLGQMFGHLQHRRRVFASLVVVIATVGMWDAFAEEGVLQLAGAGAFREMLLDSPPTLRAGAKVGVSVVGVRLDEPSRPYDPGAVHVLLGPGGVEPGLLCVRVISRDGRYSARARYTLTPDAGPKPILETRTSYSKQLAAYQTTDMAIVTERAKDCDGARDGSLFGVNFGAASGGPIVVLIDAGDARVRAQLGQNNKAVAPPVLCSALPGSIRVGFTQECRLELPTNAESGDYQLALAETTTTGDLATQTYRLVLYRGDIAPR